MFKMRPYVLHTQQQDEANRSRNEYRKVSAADQQRPAHILFDQQAENQSAHVRPNIERPTGLRTVHLSFTVLDMSRTKESGSDRIGDMKMKPER